MSEDSERTTENTEFVRLQALVRYIRQLRYLESQAAAMPDGAERAGLEASISYWQETVRRMLERSTGLRMH